MATTSRRLTGILIACLFIVITALFTMCTAAEHVLQKTFPTLTVTVPVRTSFSIDPNTETVLSSDIPIINQSNIDVRIGVSGRCADNTDTILISPDTYTDWSVLGEDETKKGIALGLKQEDETTIWLSGNPVPDGEIELEAKGRTDCSFDIRSGLAWSTPCTLEYQIHLTVCAAEQPSSSIWFSDVEGNDLGNDIYIAVLEYVPITSAPRFDNVRLMIEDNSNDFTIDPYGFPRSTAYFEGSGIQYGMTVLEDMDETGAYIYSFVASGLERTSGRFTPIEKELPKGVPITCNTELDPEKKYIIVAENIHPVTVTNSFGDSAVLNIHFVVLNG